MNMEIPRTDTTHISHTAPRLIQVKIVFVFFIFGFFLILSPSSYAQIDTTALDQGLADFASDWGGLSSGDLQAMAVSVDDPGAKEKLQALARQQAAEEQKKFWNVLRESIKKQLSATFFKNVVGGLANTIAQQTALWVVDGAGGKPRFIDDFNGFIKGYADGVVGDLVSGLVQDLTGINLCTFDPRITLDLSLAIPFFPTPAGMGYTPDCSWSNLVDHWEEIGKGKFLTVNFDLTAGRFPETTQNLKNQVITEDNLKLFPNKKWARDYLVARGTPGQLSAQYGEGRLVVAEPQAQKLLTAYTIEADNVRLRIADALTELQERQKTKPVTREELRAKREEVTKDYIDANLARLNADLIKPLSRCVGKNWNEYLNPQTCAPAATLVGMMPDSNSVPETFDEPDPERPGSTITTSPQNEFTTLTSEKIALAYKYTQTTKTIFEDLKQTVEDTLKEEFLTPDEPWDLQTASSIFNPSANQFNIQRDIATEIINEGMSAYLSRRTQATIDQGWKSITESISGAVKTPANLIRDFTSHRLTDPSRAEVALQYTGEIVADATGVFMTTLWNGYMAKLMQALNSKGTTESYEFTVAQSTCEEIIRQDPNNIPQYCQAVAEVAVSRGTGSLFEQSITTPQAIERRITNIGQAYQTIGTLTNLDLLAEFQIQISGGLNPNLYNNVIDSNFALAINNKSTIAEAISKGQLVGNNRFSFGESAEPGTYHLANIRKLRKARVVPLGLELAATLARDCRFRSDMGYGEYQDITSSTPNGGVGNVLSRTNIMLQNCVFRPLTGAESEAAVRQYNKDRLAIVLRATLADVVNGYNQAGTGICGDFDADESPFCNLVNPEWVLKLPPSQCFEIGKDIPAYGEILQDDRSGTRYTRCVNIASCLHDDGKGNCLDNEYGYCTKEKNLWQFNTATCRPEYATCTAYQVAGRAGVSAFLKNTLSGNAICGPQNAGCAWYSSTQINGIWQDHAQLTTQGACVSAGGLWSEGRCMTSRIYFNRFVEACDPSKEGCTEFISFNQPGNNLLADSSFEYATEGVVPAVWDVLIKREVASEAACAGDYYETCTDYNFQDESLCITNGGSWSGGCSVDGFFTQNACEGAGHIWNATCTGAVNTLANATQCATGNGRYVRYCRTSTLRYNRCDNVQFKTAGSEALERTQCEGTGGTFVGTCSLVAAGVDTAEICASINGTWSTTCVGARLYNQTQTSCQAAGGTWRGYGPFSDHAEVTRDGGAQSGQSRLRVSTASLGSNEELQLIYQSAFSDQRLQLTKPGDAFAAAAYVLAQTDTPVHMTLATVKTNQGGQVEMNSTPVTAGTAWQRNNVALLTARPGTNIQVIITARGNQPGFYIDSASLGFASTGQIQSRTITAPTISYESNPRLYYKAPPEELKCTGYDQDNPAPVLQFQSRLACEAAGGFWDQPEAGGLPVYRRGTRCYQYPPDVPACSNFAQVCLPSEVGCQLFSPNNNDPQIPAVVGLADFCPSECVGYSSYKEEPTQFNPNPTPLFSNFISSTAAQCAVSEVGCAEFTNLEAAGGERVEYYSYLRQCIKPGLGLGEKTFFTWQGRAQGSPQLITFTLKADPITGAPDTIDGSGDCRVTLGEQDLNCLRFYDTANNTFYRDFRKTISVSDNCFAYRKTTSDEANCVATKGTWNNNSCIYTVIPTEGIACRPAAVGCTEYKGNQGNNVRNILFDIFESTQNPTQGWFSGESGASTGTLAAVSESIALGGRSLLVPVGVSAINKPTEIEAGATYTLSFWARTERVTGDTIGIRFSTARDDGNSQTREVFATEAGGEASLTTGWRNYTVGPVYISWNDIFNTRLIFSGFDDRAYIDNILLKRSNDSIFVVKNSWSTPASCDREITGEPQVGAMINCRAYTNSAGQQLTLRSFSNICRAKAIGCQAVIDTRNSVSPYAQEFNTDNASVLDDVIVPADRLRTLVLDPQYACEESNKGCTQVGKAIFEGVTLASYQRQYVKNTPDRYRGVPNAILCTDDALGCQELINSSGGSEYYKIDETKLCVFDAVRGWVKKGAPTIGCSAIEAATPTACSAQGGVWTAATQSCSLQIKGIVTQALCEQKNGTWIPSLPSATIGICAANPFSVITTENEGYAGWVGQCEVSQNGCTEFIDVNPNFIFNGDFETIQPATRTAANWTVENSNAGTQLANTSIIRSGAQSLELRKSTDRTNPVTIVQTEGSAPYAIRQVASRLEAGKTYVISFSYFAGDAQRGQGDACPIPEASFEFNYYDAGGVNRTNNPITSYAGDDRWVRVETLYTAPARPDLPSLQNHTLKLFAPQNGICVTSESPIDCAPFGTYKNNECHRYQELTGALIINQAQCGALGGTWRGNCTQSSVMYDRVEIKPATEDRYFILDAGQNVDRASCSRVDWNSGCIQFTNATTGREEIIKVQRDRVCGEWLECSEKYVASDNHCIVTDVVIEDGVSREVSRRDDTLNTQQLCEAPRGIWNQSPSVCIDVRYLTEATCTAAPSKWGVVWNTTLQRCVITGLGITTQFGCELPRGVWNGTSCSNPIATNQSECIAPSGVWFTPQGTCSDDRYTTRAACLAKKGTWRTLEGLCKSVELCTERSQGVCTSYATSIDSTTGSEFGRQDNVRYDNQGDPVLVNRISNFIAQTGYIYRFGTANLDRLTQWRAGDYSGYTIPNRYPIESEDAFRRYPPDIDAVTRRATSLQCRIFPEETSPFPYELKTVQRYQNLPNLYVNTTGNAISGLGNLCSYTTAEVQGRTVYYKRGAFTGNDRACTAPTQDFGKPCSSDADCSGQNGACQRITSLQDFVGIEGLCLEADTLNPIYGTIYQQASLAEVQPYACLTYYPIEIDWNLVDAERDGNFSNNSAP